MKRYICLLLAMLLLLAGCQAEEPKPTESVNTSSELIPGTLYTGKLVPEAGIFQRSMSCNDGEFAEIESGYYIMSGTFLYYADKSDLNNWVPVCSNPECRHTESEHLSCSAFIQNYMFCKDGRIFFMDSLEYYPQYYDLDDKAAGLGLMSMAGNGTDIRLEHVYEPGIIAKAPYGSGLAMILYENCYILYADHYETDGTFTPKIIWVEPETNEGSVLMERSEDRTVTMSHIFFSANKMLGLCGDPAFLTSFDGLDYSKSFYWIHKGKALAVDTETINLFSSYLSGNILRTYRQNDGYYDIDLLTGEETRLANAQLTDGKAKLLLHNCILEWNDKELRLFDGQQWRSVALPEEFAQSQEGLQVGPLAVCSDRILLTRRVDGTANNRLLYAIMLTDGQLKLEQIGKITLPRN